MSIKNRLTVATVAALGLVTLASTSVHAAPAERVKVGLLKCEVNHGHAFVLGSTRHVECVYSPLKGHEVAAYRGEIKRFGVDVGYLKHGVMLWGVLASTSDLRPEALAGHYVGADVEASLGLGAGADVLVGGSRSTVALQPLSVEGLKGVNVAAGVEELTLEPAPLPPTG